MKWNECYSHYHATLSLFSAQGRREGGRGAKGGGGGGGGARRKEMDPSLLT